MLDGIKSMLNSEKALASGVLMIFSCVFVLTGQMSVQEWASYTTGLLGIYTAGKTVQGAVATWSLGGGKAPNNVPGPAPDDNVKFPK